MDQVGRVAQESVRGIEQIPCNLLHPIPVGSDADSSDLHGAGLELDDEEHHVADRPEHAKANHTTIGADRFPDSTGGNQRLWTATDGVRHERKYRSDTRSAPTLMAIWQSLGMRLQWAGAATVGLALGACGVISGLDQYSSNNCGDGCDGTADAAASRDGHTSFDSAVDGLVPPDGTGEELEVADEGAPACDTGDGACDGVCVDEQTDNNNCGGCGSSFACTSGATCQSGACTGGGSDAGPEAGCTQVTLPPSVNVDVSQWAPNFKTSPTWTCSAAGTTTVDSAAGTVISTSCALGTPDVSNNVGQSVSGGPNIMVVRLQGLSVTNNHVIHIQGDKPVVFLVAGNVIIDSGGSVDASANGATAGAGGSIAANCPGSTGIATAAMNGGGGGGGFGTSGGYGADSNGSNGAAGGAASTSTSLRPLRGGCSGGKAASGSGSTAGAGGGAFEISASGTISIGTGSNSAILSASGGFSTGATGTNTGSAGAGSGGGILLASPAAATFGSGGSARAHGGGSGSGRGVGSNGNSGSNGHTGDNNPASGGSAPDINAAAGANGGLCAGNNCVGASAPGSHGVGSQASGLDGSGGGGGGGSVQVVVSAVTVSCE